VFTFSGSADETSSRPSLRCSWLLKTLILLFVMLSVYGTSTMATTSESTLVRNRRSQQRYPPNTCHALTSPRFYSEQLTTEDKLLLSSIVAQGKLISRSKVYHGLYFVSFRVINLLKGKLPKKLRRHIRLMFKLELNEPKEKVKD
jgi:hypothetical protein